MLRNLVPMAFVADVRRSVAYYEQLGFHVSRSIPMDEGLRWAWLESDRAQLMLSVASDPVDAGVQAILFYLYVDDVAAARADYAARGLAPGEITTPSHAPRGEFRLHDPDGYVLLVMHT